MLWFIVCRRWLACAALAVSVRPTPVEWHVLFISWPLLGCMCRARGFSATVAASIGMVRFFFCRCWVVCAAFAVSLRASPPRLVGSVSFVVSAAFLRVLGASLRVSAARLCVSGASLRVSGASLSLRVSGASFRVSGRSARLWRVSSCLGRVFPRLWHVSPRLWRVSSRGWRVLPCVGCRFPAMLLKSLIWVVRAPLKGRPPFKKSRPSAAPGADTFLNSLLVLS